MPFLVWGFLVKLNIRKKGTLFMKGLLRNPGSSSSETGLLLTKLSLDNSYRTCFVESQRFQEQGHDRDDVSNHTSITGVHNRSSRLLVKTSAVSSSVTGRRVESKCWQVLTLYSGADLEHCNMNLTSKHK